MWILNIIWTNILFRRDKQNSTGDESIMEKQTKHKICNICVALGKAEKSIDLKEDLEMVQTIAFHNGVQQGKAQAISEFKEKLKVELLKNKFITNQGSSVIAEYNVIEIIDKTAQEITK